MIEDSFAIVTMLGTQWPVPRTWRPTADGGFSGSEGILNLVSFEGELVDPNRCQAAAKQRPGAWSLAMTINGQSIYGRYTKRGALIALSIVRSEPPPVTDWLFPEIQASYVFAPSARDLADRIASKLQVLPIPEVDYGLLDEYGHATMGPIPVLTSWTSVGDEDRGPPYGSLGEKAVLTLVGGGVITLSDAPRCCRLVFAPLRVRESSSEAAIASIRTSLAGSDVRITNGARVWNWQIAGEGCSYEAFIPTTGSRVVGAAWADQFGQSWHLRYTFGPDHGKTVEQELLTAKDELAEVKP